jgi:hypothetical protein
MTLQRGWHAFRRAPLVFMAFTLLAGGSQLLGQLLQNRGSDGLSGGGEPAGLYLAMALAGLAGSVVSSLWLSVGLFRGAWIALSGRRPRFGDLARWNGGAMGRLLGMGLLLLLLNLLILVIAGLTAGLLSLLWPPLGLLPLLVGGALVLRLAVTQMFHLPLVVVGGLRPVPAFLSGESAVKPQWLRMFLFLLPLALLLILGGMLLGLGLLVTWPVVICCLADAYQHVFGREDRAGLLSRR